MIGKTIVVICLAALGCLPCAARADSHRTETAPTAWWWYYNVTEAQIETILDDTGARLVDIEIHSTDPLRFSAAFVHNSGVYAEAWWWYYNLTEADVGTLVAANEARLIDIERYDTPAGARYAVVMIGNSGRDAIAWWWYYGGNIESLTDHLLDNEARLIDIEAYESGGTRYLAIMVDNTGDANTPWWWYYNVPAATLVDCMEDNDARLLEFEVRDPAAGTYDAILVPNEAPDNISWWWYYGVTAADLNALLAQNGARIADLDTYMHGGTRRFSVVMLNNSNALTTKMGGLLDYGADGSTGVYLKEVGGPVLASLQPDFVYEPASSIKVTHHLYAMRQVAARADALSNTFLVAKGLDGSCPNGGAPYYTQSLEMTLRSMMQDSDNADTEAIAQRYGTAAINANERTAGQDADSRRDLRCGPPRDRVARTRWQRPPVCLGQLLLPSRYGITHRDEANGAVEIESIARQFWCRSTTSRPPTVDPPDSPSDS